MSDVTGWAKSDRHTSASNLSNLLEYASICGENSTLASSNSVRLFARSCKITSKDWPSPNSPRARASFVRSSSSSAPSFSRLALDSCKRFFVLEIKSSCLEDVEMMPIISRKFHTPIVAATVDKLHSDGPSLFSQCDFSTPNITRIFVRAPETLITKYMPCVRFRGSSGNRAVRGSESTNRRGGPLGKQAPTPSTRIHGNTTHTTGACLQERRLRSPTSACSVERI